MNAFDIAWSLLKADPAAQMVDSMGRRTGMGTIHPAIMGMLARQGQEGLDEGLMSAQVQGRLDTKDVGLPMENLRDVRQRFGDESRFVPEVQHEDHGMGDIATPTTDQEFFDTGQALASEGRVTPAHFKGGEVTPGPEEGFLTPSQAFASDPALAANLRRNVGGQQQGSIMDIRGRGNKGFSPTDMEASRGAQANLGRGEGVANRMKLRNRNQAVEPEAPAPKLSPEQQLQQRLQAMAAESGMHFTPTIDMTPQNTTPMEIPMEIQNKIRDVPNYGMNEAAAELGVDPSEVRRGMKALPGFRSGPSARKLEYDKTAANLPGSEGYDEFKQSQAEEAAMGIGDEDSMYSELMGMEGGLSPEANAAALARLGLSPTDIDLADHDMRAAEAKNPTPDLRSMRGMGVQIDDGTPADTRSLTAEEMAAINMGRSPAPRTRQTAYDKRLSGGGIELTDEERAAASARADKKLGRNQTRL